MNYDVLPSVCLAVIAVFVVQGMTIYSITKLLITGRALVEKREQEPESESRVIGIHGGR